MRYAWLVVGLAACTDEVPATPSFQQHVAPILAANCARCHMEPYHGGAPSGLVHFDAEFTPRSEINPGTATTIARRVAEGTMPPLLPLDDAQVETIVRWAEQGGERGEPRVGNRRPELRGLDITRTTVVIDMFDPDGDLFAGDLFDDGPMGPSTLGELQQGRTTIQLETDRLYLLRARVDDGGAIFDVDLGGVQL